MCLKLEASVTRLLGLPSRFPCFLQHSQRSLTTVIFIHPLQDFHAFVAPVARHFRDFALVGDSSRQFPTARHFSRPFAVVRHYLAMDPSPIHAQVQQLISRALTGIPPLPASHGTLANTQGIDPNRVPLKPLPQALANAGNPNACKICHVDILGGPKFRICLSCGAPSHLYPATRSSLDAALSTERSSRQSAGSGDTRSSDASRGSSVTGSFPGTSISGTPIASNDKSGLWRNTRIERRYLMSLEFKPQDDKRRRSSSTQPSERTLAETLAGINAPPPDATSTRGSTNTRGSTGSAGRTSNASGVTSARGSTGAPPPGGTSTRGSSSSTASSAGGAAAGAAGTGGKSAGGGVGAGAGAAAAAGGGGGGAGADATTAAASAPAAPAAAVPPPAPSQAPDFIPDDFFAAPSTVSTTSTPAALSFAPAAQSTALPTPLPAPGALPTTAPTAAHAATSAPPAAVPTIPNVGVATAAAPSSFFAASFGSGGGQQQQGAAAVTPERHSSGSSALDFFSQLSGITSSVLSGTTSSSSSAHPSGATHANDPAAAGMSAFTGNFAGSFPGSQPYASHDGQFGQFVKPEPANPVVQEILQSLPDLSFMLADHLVVPGRDPGGLREFNSRPKVSAASIIASCVPRRAITHAAAALAAGGTGADAGAAAAPAAALVDSSASGTVEIQSTAPASAAATNAAATMEAEESGKQQMPTAGFDSLEDSAGVGHAAITAPAANMASTAPAGVGSATAVSDPGMAPPVAETSVSSVIAGMSMGGFMDDAEEDNDDWGDFES